MEVLGEYIASVKVYAFPIAGMLLVLYPAALMAWTVIEGRSAPHSNKEQEGQQKDQRRGAEKDDFKKPQKPQQSGEGAWISRAKCWKIRRTMAAALAVVVSLWASRRFTSFCFVSAPPKLPTPIEASSFSSTFASFTFSAQPAAAAMSALAAVAAGAAYKLPFARRRSNRRTLGKRSGSSTKRAATFTKSVDVNQSGFFDRQLSGPWTAAEAPAFEEQDSTSNGEISMWHDVDLYVKSWLDEPTALLRYVNEMPMGTLRKYEVQPGAPHNAIEEDVKGSKKLAAFGKPVPFNYGCFPQTYRDPEKADELYSAPGDDDPLDVIDLADAPTEVGTIVRCRVLGAVCLIDEGQADWKVLVVNVDSNTALASACSIEEVERISPGRIQACWSWMDELKSRGGKAKLHRNIHDAECALKLIQEDHASWKELVNSAGPDGTARGHWICNPQNEDAAAIQVLKLGWAPPCVVPGQQVRSPCMLAGAARVSVLARAARAVQLARTQ